MYKRSRDTAVGMATGYRQDSRGVGIRVPERSRIFSSPCRPGHLWSPYSLAIMNFNLTDTLVREAQNVASQVPL
jgi:hypothetical protein